MDRRRRTGERGGTQRGLTSHVIAWVLAQARLPKLKVETSYGKFLRIFPLNVFNKAALTLFGVAGILASRARTENPARGFSRAVAIAMGPLALLGVIPRTETPFGMLPLFGAEVAAHGTFAAIGAKVGFTDGLGR